MQGQSKLQPLRQVPSVTGAPERKRRCEMFETILDSLWEFTLEEQKKMVDLFAGEEAVTEELLAKLIDAYGDDEIVWYVLTKHFKVSCVSEGFLLSMIDDFADEELTLYILRHHFQGGKISPKTLTALVDELGACDITREIIHNHI